MRGIIPDDYLVFRALGAEAVEIVIVAVISVPLIGFGVIKPFRCAWTDANSAFFGFLARRADKNIINAVILR